MSVSRSDLHQYFDQSYKQEIKNLNARGKGSLSADRSSLELQKLSNEAQRRMFAQVVQALKSQEAQIDQLKSRLDFKA